VKVQETVSDEDKAQMKPPSISRLSLYKALMRKLSASSHPANTPINQKGVSQAHCSINYLRAQSFLIERDRWGFNLRHSRPIVCSDNVYAAIVPDGQFSGHYAVVSGQRDVSRWSATNQRNNVDANDL